MLVKKKTVIFIVGPTAIGKTSLAVKLARRIKGEIISCDSMQIYEGMDILSQAPSPAALKKVRCHLVKFLNPQKDFSVALFRQKASSLIEKIIKNKKVPVVAGGSGLYVKGLIDGLFPSPKADLNLRKRMYSYAKRYGSARLHKKLQKIDPAQAGLIHPNDTRRIVRALEIYHSTGRTMTELKAGTKGIAGKYDVRIFGLTAPREDIYENINKRVDGMLTAGVVDEVRRLSRKRLSVTAAAVLGFKEISGYLDGEYSLEEASELMKRSTRRFAKRQVTWFKKDNRIKWFNTGRISEENILKNIARKVA